MLLQLKRDALPRMTGLPAVSADPALVSKACMLTGQMLVISTQQARSPHLRWLDVEPLCVVTLRAGALHRGRHHGISRIPNVPHTIWLAPHARRAGDSELPAILQLHGRIVQAVVKLDPGDSGLVLQRQGRDAGGSALSEAVISGQCMEYSAPAGQEYGK